MLFKRYCGFDQNENALHFIRQIFVPKGSDVNKGGKTITTNIYFFISKKKVFINFETKCDPRYTAFCFFLHEDN